MAALEATTYSFTLLIGAPKFRLLVAGLCLAAALLVGALVIALVSRWRRRSEAKDDLSPSAQLAHFRSLYEAGTISRDEFNRLRTLLSGQMRETRGVPAPVPETPAKPPPGAGEQPPDNPETGIRPA
jgi:hypothetical protein